MKIVITTTFLVAVLATGLFGINNVFAQGDDGGMMEGNDTGSSDGGMTMNATLPMSIISDDSSKPMNATLAFAQGEGNDTMSMGNDTSMMMNATLPMSIIGDNDTSKPDASKPMKP
jgi:hypothetical protein